MLYLFNDWYINYDFIYNMFCGYITYSVACYITCYTALFCSKTKAVCNMKCMLYNISQPSKWLSWKTLKLGYPWLSLRSEQRYPFLSLLIQTYTIEAQRDPWISHYKNLILAYPKTAYLSRLIQGYSWISHSFGYPGISLDKSYLGLSWDIPV